MTDTLMPAAEAWFESQCWDVFAFQREAWEAFDAGASGLIHSPTGSGKTLAAWMGPLCRLGMQTGGLRVLWITP